MVLNPFGPLNTDAAAFQAVDDGGFKLAVGGSDMINEDQATDSNGNGVPGEATDARSENSTRGLELQMFAGPVSLLAEHFARTRARNQGFGDGWDGG